MLTLNLKGNPKGDWVTLRLFDPLKEVTRSLLITKSMQKANKNIIIININLDDIKSASRAVSY